MANCTVRRNWILGGYSAEYTHTLSADAATFSNLVNELLEALYHHLLGDKCSNSLKDFKGRERRDTLLAGIPGEAEDEIFRVGGTIATEERGDDFDWSPFDVSCHAAFESFEGTHHIRYSTNLHRSKTVPAWLPWKLLGAAGPIRPTYCRVGLERFQSKFTLSSVGFMPQVTDTVILDAINGTVSLQVVTDQAAWKPCNPLEETPIFSGIDRALRASAGFNLADSFREELSKAAKFPRK